MCRVLNPFTSPFNFVQHEQRGIEDLKGYINTNAPWWEE